MGYMGLKRWNDSDRAADVYHTIIMPLLKELNKAISVRDNGYNTSGPENVAMIIESGLLDAVPDYYIQDYFDHNALLKGLNETIAHAGPKNKDEWADEANRRSHLRSYQRMLKNVTAFLRKKNINIA